MKTMEGFQAHLIGIRGNGMRALADVLSDWGWKISGSDISLQGHSAENLPPRTDLVIHSDAIPPENPEILHAAELGIPTLSYFQALGKITSGVLHGAGCQPALNGTFSGQVRNLPHLTLAIAGTHGKSTTTAIIGHIFTQAGQNPTVFCGAAPMGKNSGGRAGREEFFVVEACEYRKNFLHLQPTHAALLGIELDHFDCFENLTQIEAAFREFAELVSVEGLLLYRDDCPTTQKVVRNLNCRKQSFGFSPAADWSAKNLRCNEGYYRFSIFKRGEFVLEVPLPIPGKYNILNALAAAAMSSENGCSAEQIQYGLATFPGLHRRFEIIRKAGFQPALKTRQVENLPYVLDYAHHPTEVASALRTVREVFPNRRIWCIFQPHQASRTAQLLDELAISLQNADNIIVADIFRAREGCPKPGEVNAADLTRRVVEMAKAGKNAVQVLPVHQTDDIMDILTTQLRDNDVIIILGAGDIHSVLGLGA